MKWLDLPFSWWSSYFILSMTISVGCKFNSAFTSIFQPLLWLCLSYCSSRLVPVFVHVFFPSLIMNLRSFVDVYFHINFSHSFLIYFKVSLYFFFSHSCNVIISFANFTVLFAGFLHRNLKLLPNIIFFYSVERSFSSIKYTWISVRFQINFSPKYLSQHKYWTISLIFLIFHIYFYNYWTHPEHSILLFMNTFYFPFTSWMVENMFIFSWQKHGKLCNPYADDKITSTHTSRPSDNLHIRFRHFCLHYFSCCPRIDIKHLSGCWMVLWQISAPYAYYRQYNAVINRGPFSL